MNDQTHNSHLINNLLYGLFAGILIFLATCPEEPEPEYEINLILEDFLCTWVELRVILPDSGKTKYFYVRSTDGQIEVTPPKGVIRSDTVLHIDGLQPEAEYSFRAYYLRNERIVDSSEAVTIHTRETTSSDFRWEIDRIGVHPTHFNDVQIISENDVWAVGDIRLEDTYTYDSAGVWQLPYSAAHWDGNKWKLVRFIDEYGYVISPNGFYYFSDTSIWFTPGRIHHYDSDTTRVMWTQNYSAGEFLYRVWGSSEDDIWFVGSKGLIVHYDGQTFSRIPTGNTIRYVDLEGTPDGKHVFVVGNNILVPYECCVWHIDDGEMNMIYYTDKSAPTDGKYGEVMSVGVYDHYAYFQTAAGIWIYDFEDKSSELYIQTANVPIRSVIVQDRNDILGMGGGGSWIHFNGVNWTVNEDFYWAYTIAWLRADFKNNFTVMAGVARDASCGMIIRGYR